MPRPNRAILDQIVSLSREAVLIADLRRPGFPIVYANPAFEALACVASGEAEGRDWAFFLDAEAEQIQALAGRVRAGVRCENALVNSKQIDVKFHLTMTPLPDRRGRHRYLLVQVDPFADAPVVTADYPAAARPGESLRSRDVNVTSDRRDLDSGLLRYDYFLELCERDFALCSRQRADVAMMTFTIGQFDVYRQTFGKKSAQSCLRMVGGRIAGALRRAGDLCARLDDASFVALVTGHDPEEAAQFAQYIAREVRRLALHHPRASGERYVTCSVGLRVGVPESRDTPESFVLAARERQALNSHEHQQQPAA